MISAITVRNPLFAKEMAEHSAESITKLGTVFGFYFLIQAYGYAIGFESTDLHESAKIELNEAVVFGFAHISHILRPWDSVAWPLCPVLGLPLLLIVLYGKGTTFLSKVSSWRFLFALFASTMLYPLVSGVMGADRCAELVDCVAQATLNYREFPIFLSIAYLAGWSFWVWFFRTIVFTPDRTEKILNKAKLLPQGLESNILVGLLFFSVYLGSEFDGALDKHMRSSEQNDADKPAATLESKTEGESKPQPEPEEFPQ